MDATHDFLDLLELDDAAEERDIRRAYARKLKRIDQEADPARFQALRHAYEVALDWARWKLAQDADASAPAAPTPVHEAPPPQEAEPQPPEAMRLGGEVFGRLGQSAKALQENGQLGDVAAWRAAIEARFGDEELVNIDARIYFEAFVASMLAKGWRPGHEALFVAAKDAFGWDGDRRRLYQLGQGGRLLDQAIEERHVFDALPAEEQVRMRDLARMLRQPDLPETRRIRAAMPDTERMLARFPALMAVVTDMENAERWRTAWRASGGAPIAFEAQDAVPAPAEPKRSFATWQGVILFMVLSVVLRGVFNYAGGEQESGRGFIPPAGQQSPIPQRLPAPQVVLPSVLERVVPPVRYTPPPGTPLGTLEVIYKVFLSEDLRVERVQSWQTSGDPGFDAAVGLALRNAAPFPIGTPREFEVRYSGDMVRPAAKRTPAPAMTPVPAKTLKEHIPPISFKPDRFTREGKYTGRYGATLDAAGRVIEVRTLQPSGDILLDRAVENALRDAKPFPGAGRTLEFTYSTTVFRKPQQSEGEGGRDAPPEQ